MKRKGMAPILTVFLVAAVLGLMAYMFVPGVKEMFAIQGGGDDIIPAGACEYSPSVNLSSTDFYNPGTAITTENMYREKGELTWTDIGSTDGFTANPGKTYEICWGTNTTADTPSVMAHGKCLEYLIPCLPTYKATFAEMRNDALQSEVTGTVIDVEDSTPILSTGGSQYRIDIDAGDTPTIEVRLSATNEKDYGNIFCGETSNVIVVHVNKTQYDEENFAASWKGKSLNRVSAPPSLNAANGYVDLAFQAPVLTSSEIEYVYLFWDADATANVTGYQSNASIYLFDSAQFLDQNDNIVKCGVNDENGKDIGAGNYTEMTVYVQDDTT